VSGGVAIADATAAEMSARVEASLKAREEPVTRGPEPAMTALMLLPGALVVFMGFNAGGYFPAAPAAAAIVLAQILLARSLRSRYPFEGLARGTLVAIGALGLYAALTLASALWSHSTSRALIEFDRTWLYLVVLVLFGSVRTSAADVRWLIRGLALGASIVCLAGLISRVAPDAWHTAPDVANERLSYPVTYWNALGLLAALAIVLAFHLTCTLSERRWVRIIAAGLLPLLAVTLFFTFSRGAIAAAVIGLVLYVLVARPRGLQSGALATLPGCGVLLLLAYHANLLDTVDPTTPAAVAQGHRLALAAGACVAACAGLRLLLASVLDPRLRRGAGRGRMGGHARLAAIAGAAAAVLVVGLAFGAPRSLAHDWSLFFSGAAPNGNQGDLRQRLTDPANNGRSDLWHVALHGFGSAPINGHGAGTFQILWDRKRPYFAHDVNAHGLYLQAMAEFGILGLLALLALVGAVLAGLGSRARGRRRSLYGALLAVAIVWALHAGVDWDWEMPVVTLGFFAAAGAALSPRGQPAQRWAPSKRSRAILALACLAGVVLPMLIIGSQSRLDRAERALYASDCTKATAAARSSLDFLSVRPQPYEILGFCALRRGEPRRGVSAMREALSRDAGSWETYYALAIAQAADGADPRAAGRRALRMNPHEPLTLEAVRMLRGSGARRWRAEAPGLLAAALASNDLSIVPS